MKKGLLVVLLLGIGVQLSLANPLLTLDDRDIDLNSTHDVDRNRSIKICPAKASVSEESVIRIEFGVDLTPVTIIIRDASGNVYEWITQNVVAGEIVEVDMNSLAPGSYLLQLEYDEESWSGKFDVK